MATIMAWLMLNGSKLLKVLSGVLVAVLIAACSILAYHNKQLSQGLQMANNNIEAYQGIIENSQQANNVLKLDIETLNQQNDKILHELDSVRKKLRIKPKQITTAATQSQVLNVTQSTGVGGDIIQILKDTVYNDSIKFNDLTTVYYTIGTDTICVTLDINNTQYLYIYKKREYKNKKNFLKRLFTFDFKKVNKYKYEIVNTNDLLKTENVRIVESNQ